jgi:predicted permease
MMIETLWHDLRYAMRMLIKRPGFSVVVILALALGIGANTAIFSIVNAVLLRALPFKDAERLVVISETVRRESIERRAASYPDFVDWREQNQVFEEIAAYEGQNLIITGGSEPERLNGEIVSASYFSLLGAQAAMGRTFLSSEDAVPDAHPVVVVSHALWQRRFGSNPNLVGQTLQLNDKVFTVVGVMPEDFRGMSGEAEVWIPMMMISAFRSPKTLEERGARWHSAIGRLKPGVTLEQAQAEMTTIMSRLEQQYPASNRNRGALLIPAHEEAFRDLRLALLVLLCAVAFVLLIACANVANLLLARAATRQKEIAIRTALGASRWRLIRQLLTESVLLSLLGAALGLGLAYWGVDLLVALNPVELPSFVRINIDARVLFFTLLIALVVGVLFGLAPALQASRPDLNETLKEGGRTSAGGSRQRLRSALVISEMALALVLLVMAGLMLRSFQRMQKVDPGFRADLVLTMQTALPPQRYEADASKMVFSQRLREKIEALPGVESVAVASDLPLKGSSSAIFATAESKAARETDLHPRVYTHSISPGFFQTLGIPLTRGRDFTAQDVLESPLVVIISDSMARRYWPEGDAVGARVRLGTEAKDPWATVVGVAADVRHRELIRQSNTDPDIYLSLFQQPTDSLGLVVRSKSDAAGLAAAVRHEVQSLDPNLPLYSIETMEQLLSGQTAGARFSAVILLFFALLALVLAVAGIYGVMAYSVTQRTHEIAIRMALGAQARDVLRLVVGQGMLLALIGVGLGLVAAFALTRLMSSLLYGVSATDPATFIFIPLLLASVALLASYIPARRATKVDPMEALRYE